MLWRTYLDLHCQRGSNGFGPAPIGYADVLAWQRVHDIRLTPWETETLLQMDRAALSAQAESIPKGN